MRLFAFQAGLAAKEAITGEKTPEEVAPIIEPPPALASFVSRTSVRRILTVLLSGDENIYFRELNPDELRLYFTLTRRAEAPQTTIESPREVFEPQMIQIPAGKFLMGSTRDQASQAIKDGADKDWVADELTQHEVELSEYYIGKYPVTNLEYQVFLREVSIKSPPGWDGYNYPNEKGDHPVVNISWDDAKSFCDWLSKKTGNPYRLPTEAEWEKASRGTDGRIWPWGNEFDPKNANTLEANLGGRTSPVGQFSPQGDSPYGCVDMIGNVWEWCSDWYDKNEYTRRNGALIKDPNGPDNGQTHVLRGGSFGTDRAGNRCADRIQFMKLLFAGRYGFRVAASLHKDSTKNIDGREYYGEDFTRE